MGHGDGWGQTERRRQTDCLVASGSLAPTGYLVRSCAAAPWRSFIRTISTNPNHIREIARWKWKFKWLQCLSSFVNIWLLTRCTHTQGHPQQNAERSMLEEAAGPETLRALPAVPGVVEAPLTPLLNLCTPSMQQPVGPRCNLTSGKRWEGVWRKNGFGGLCTLHHEILGSRPAAGKAYGLHVKHHLTTALKILFNSCLRP